MKVSLTNLNLKERRIQMEIKNSLKTILKRLKLSGILATLPERIAYAQKVKLPDEDLLELILQDEVDRRDQVNLQRRLTRACFTEEQTFENFDWDAPVGFDRHRVRDLFSLSFIEAKQDVLFMGSVGVGKTFLASALGHAACRAGYDVLFIRADQMFLELKQSRADYSHDKALRRFLTPDLLILDDFALRRLDTTQSNDIYEVVIERHRRSSTILTSNRHVDEWIPLFDDPILAQSALDRLSHNAYQVQIEGESFRNRQRPDLLASNSKMSTNLEKE